MGRDISIAISAKDNYTQAITTMRNANQSFNKDLEGLTTKLNSLNSTRVSLRMDTDQAKRALKDAEKQFALTGDAADKLAAGLANENYENARRNLDLVSKNAKQAEKDILSLTDAVSRSENRAGGSGSSGGGISGAEGAMSALAKAGLGKMVGDSLSGALDVGISSAFGSNMGDAISTSLAGAVSGAAIGSIVPGIGTAIGAAVGAVAGGISAATQYFEKYDDAFRGEVESQIASANESIEGALLPGLQLSGQWASNLMAFKAFLPGKGDAFLEELRIMDKENPFDLAGLATQSKLLLTSGVSKDDTMRTLSGVGNAAAITGMAPEDMTQIAETIGYLGNLSTLTKRQTDIFTMRGIPIIDYLAKAHGVTKAAVYEAMSDGDISGPEAQQIVIDGMEGDPRFAGAAKALMNTLAGAQSALDSEYDGIKKKMGMAYEDTMIPKKQDELNILDSGLGDALGEAYAMAGRGMAEREALQQKYLTDARNAVFSGANISELYSSNSEVTERLEGMRERYQTASSQGDNIGVESILKEVESFADTAFKNSPEMASLAESQTDLLNNVQETNALFPGYIENTLAYQNEMSKGLQSIQTAIGTLQITPYTPSADLSESQNFWASANHYAEEYGMNSTDPMADYYAPARAMGVPYVPYDNYLIRAHQGERLQTAAEVRSAQHGGAAPPTITGNNFYVREEQDIYKIAQALAGELSKAQMIS